MALPGWEGMAWLGASRLLTGLLGLRRLQRIDALSQILKLGLHLLTLKLIDAPSQLRLLCLNLLIFSTPFFPEIVC